MPTDPEYSVVLSTCANAEDAKALAEKLLSAQLAACIQVVPITSYYTWKGEQAQESEMLLLIKARSEHYAEIERTLKASHKYEVPEIVQLPIQAGFAPYLDWIHQVTK